MIRILVADDDAAVRAELRSLLADEPDMDVVGEAGDGPEAVARAHALRPDVVLMDVVMPGLNGIEATRQIRAALPGSRVVSLSMYDDPQFREAMDAAGASAFVLKENAGSELASEIRRVQG